MATQEVHIGVWLYLGAQERSPLVRPVEVYDDRRMRFGCGKL